MTQARGFTGWPGGPIHLAIGVFDGVHAGHREVIARLAAGARADHARAVAATFEPLPGRFLDPVRAPQEITDTAERVRLLREAGADTVVLFHFDKALATLEPVEFVARLRAAGDLRRVVVGSDFQFGRDRSGALDTLRALGREHGFAVEEVEPVVQGGAVVSSTRIRGLLAAGDLSGAAALLGRRYGVRGTIVGGDFRGTGMGYPTANLKVAPERLLPRDGIYAAWVDVGGARHAAAASLGVRPTFGDSLERRLEAYLLDFTGDLYGQDAVLTFVERLRDEERFNTIDTLTAQIGRDVVAVRHALARTS